MKGLTFEELTKMWLDSHGVPHDVLNNPSCQAAIRDEDPVDTMKYMSGYHPPLRTTEAKWEFMQLAASLRKPKKRKSA